MSCFTNIADVTNEFGKFNHKFLLPLIFHRQISGFYRIIPFYHSASLIFLYFSALIF